MNTAPIFEATRVTFTTTVEFDRVPSQETIALLQQRFAQVAAELEPPLRDGNGTPEGLLPDGWKLHPRRLVVPPPPEEPDGYAPIIPLRRRAR